MSIGKKLLTANIVAACLILAIAGAGYWGLESVFGSTRKVLEGEAQIARQAAILRANVLGLRRYEKDILINLDDPRKVDEYVGKFRTERETLAKRLDDLQRLVVTAEDRQRVSQMPIDAGVYATGMAGIIEKIRAGQVKTAGDGNRLVNEYKDAIHRLEKNAEDLAKAANQRMDGVEGALGDQVRQTLWAMLALAVLAVAAGTG